MNRTLSYAHAKAVATDCVFSSQMALDGPGTLDDYRGELRKCVRKLRFVTKLFLAMGWAVDYPAYYAPMADALISLREALHPKFIDRDGVLCAAHYLEQFLLIDPRKGGRRHVA
jgi:hypothetical protein